MVKNNDIAFIIFFLKTNEYHVATWVITTCSAVVEKVKESHILQIHTYMDT